MNIAGKNWKTEEVWLVAITTRVMSLHSTAYDLIHRSPLFKSCEDISWNNSTDIFTMLLLGT